MKPYFGAMNDVGQWWDGRDWRNRAATTDVNAYMAETYRIVEKLSRHDVDNCHVDGCFECPRCRKMHFIPDNFDLLCDGCCTAVLAHPAATDAMREGIAVWRVKSRTDPEIEARYKLRDDLTTEEAIA